ncbi:MAG: dUTP diphosphatase [Helicobacter sp.]|nr:dUTP diphosphatase [Helicobacter sp.]MDY5740751.1 dUTP diphosphatase [Helicobacter sp.]
MQIKLKKLNPLAIIPQYQTVGSAGFDFHSVIDCVLKAGELALIPTGLALELPQDYELQIRPRSGLALNDAISVLNTPATIDSDYRGEIKVILINHSKKDFVINIGDRIAQGVVNRIYQVSFVECDALNETTRGNKGFGSSGVRMEDK